MTTIRTVTGDVHDVSAAVAALGDDVAAVRGLVAAITEPEDPGVSGDPRVAAGYASLHDDWVSGLDRLAAGLAALAVAVADVAVDYEQGEAGSAAAVTPATDRGHGR
ncbi:hypothetical protein [Dactylosporangium sp. NPDC049140]|jgi:hypothetical protein|uniref:hypothetical protein n=1 Tax=Dactylosporangium sp. NPDC049140 TaxID=3155647 RepID=UPI0033F139A9